MRSKIAKQITKAKKQHRQPGLEYKMKPKPKVTASSHHTLKKLKDKVAIITGGDSGIGHAIALAYAKEGAHIAIIYLNEHKDAKRVQSEVKALGRECLLIAGDIGNEKFCQQAVKKIKKTLKKVDILVNNAAEQHPQDSILKISSKQLIKTFTTNVFSFFYMIKAVLPFLKKGSCIINTSSVTTYKGSDHLIDYSATKGAIVALTRSLSQSLVEKGIRVNGVAPGPIWTPLIPSTFSQSHIKKFGKNVPMKRAGQPEEVAPCYVFLASDDASYMTGQMLHPNGGVIVNS